ncbi:MAG TPA: hypothetical protein VGY30_05445 [Solirubrobacteraceae bacterium]|jgi:hypothetical protein|nr:hypothetical protein [Solirubrobacteraceae bacterium]
MAVLATVALALAGLGEASGAASAAGGPLGFAQFEAQTTQGGAPPGYESEPYFFDQAGGHPFALTSTVRFTSETLAGVEGEVPAADARDVIIDLPPGLIANPQAVPRCTTPARQRCPPSTQLGSFLLRARFGGRPISLLGPLINLAPGPDETARLGLETPLGRFLLRGRLIYGPQGYGLAVVAHGLPTFGLLEMQVTLWGVPAAPVHDAERGLTCVRLQEGASWTSCMAGDLPSSIEETPFLTLPSQCSSEGPKLTAWVDSWEQPGSYAQASTTLVPMSGCDRLPFGAEVSLRPDSRLAEAPVALDVEVGAERSEAAVGVAAAPLRSASITLPPGLTIDPSAAAGARACPPSGPEGIGIPTGLGAEGQPLAPGQQGEGEAPGPGGESQLAPGHCPEASTIGTAEALSPLLARPLQGRVYLGAPGCGGAGQAPCTDADAADGNLLRVYVELGGRGSEPGGRLGEGGEGVILKLEGRLRASPATGQLTLELTDAPQLPLDRLAIKLFGGSAALLDNPTSCTGASASAELEPWSAPYFPDVAVSAPYPTSGCVDPAPFAPRMTAGSMNIEAGAFTPFIVGVTRAAREQDVSQLQLRAPPGIAAMISSVTPCPEPAAGRGECQTTARIGSSEVAVGGGWQPLWLAGDVYLAGPYEGAPFGLAIVTRAAAGPLDLGQVVIRARLDVDPQTGALTISSDPLPQIVLGVPLRLRALRLDIDRLGFIVNPTDCRERQVLASVASAQGTVAALSNPFGLADCRVLRFAPRLAASTSARQSILGGASLDIHLSQAAGPGSGQANLARLRIALPRSLSTRLTALQAACPATIFAANAAACPAASVVGVARASTPLLSGPLSGPVYLVAHGRSAFPAPTVVLEGNGLRLELTGRTAIERDGATAIAFDALPDMPLRGVELQLPRGPHSALAATGQLCAGSLRMPVELAAQNGILLHRTARIAVRGCPPPPRHSTR